MPHIAYLHIPKTGGTYIAQSEKSSIPVIKPIHYLGHTYIVDKPGIPNPLYHPRDEKNENNVILFSELEKTTVFATVRNIFSWLVSYAWHAGGWNPKYRDPEHYDYDAANKGFDYLVKTISNRDNIWPNRKFIFCQLFCNNGILVANWICRTETLDNDLNEFSSTENVTYNARPKQRVGHKTDYRDYYTDSLIETIYQTWGRELSLFGYDFDGIAPSSDALYKVISDSEKDRVHYCWGEDKLKIGNAVIE